MSLTSPQVSLSFIFNENSNLIFYYYDKNNNDRLTQRVGVT